MRLTMDQVIRYQTEGCLIVDEVLSAADLQPVIEELNEVIDQRARQMLAEGRLKELHETEPFERRLALLQEQCPDIGKGMDIADYLGDAIFALLGHDKLLDVVECLLGSEISCNPIQHVRAKLPWKSKTGDPQPSYFENVPWHQDCAVTTEDSEASEIITFWMPLVDARAETGCMEIMPEVFKRGYMTHQASGGTTIVPEQLPDVQPVLAECRKGSLVIMNKYTPHRGISNVSDIIRWSIDLRYHKTGANSGRSYQPSFVVRSAKNPDLVLRNSSEWRKLWQESRNAPQPSKVHRV
ncbi:phytanoyl-CoA dioxygenase family protein [Paenibacillus sp. GCM10027626]|uniref:phytanoyl-CoA dioxygenase family protein n=1 Tax=Paenibacillus sp. GCM10027626 TaxID=3273411 RepID=UPI003640342B